MIQWVAHPRAHTPIDYLFTRLEKRGEKANQIYKGVWEKKEEVKGGSSILHYLILKEGELQ